MFILALSSPKFLEYFNPNPIQRMGHEGIEIGITKVSVGKINRIMRNPLSKTIENP